MTRLKDEDAALYNQLVMAALRSKPLHPAQTSQLAQRGLMSANGSVERMDGKAQEEGGWALIDAVLTHERQQRASPLERLPTDLVRVLFKAKNRRGRKILSCEDRRNLLGSSPLLYRKMQAFSGRQEQLDVLRGRIYENSKGPSDTFKALLALWPHARAEDAMFDDDLDAVERGPIGIEPNAVMTHQYEHFWHLISTIRTWCGESAVEAIHLVLEQAPKTNALTYAAMIMDIAEAARVVDDHVRDRGGEPQARARYRHLGLERTLSAAQSHARDTGLDWLPHLVNLHSPSRAANREAVDHLKARFYSGDETPQWKESVWNYMVQALDRQSGNRRLFDACCDLAVHMASEHRWVAHEDLLDMMLVAWLEAQPTKVPSALQRLVNDLPAESAMAQLLAIALIRKLRLDDEDIGINVRQSRDETLAASDDALLPLRLVVKATLRLPNEPGSDELTPRRRVLLGLLDDLTDLKDMEDMAIAIESREVDTDSESSDEESVALTPEQVASDLLAQRLRAATDLQRDADLRYDEISELMALLKPA